MVVTTTGVHTFSCRNNRPRNPKDRRNTRLHLKRFIKYISENLKMASRQEEQEKKLLEFQILSSQLEQYQAQLDSMQQQKQNLSNLSASLEEISKLKKGDEFLSPLSSGVLVKTELKEAGNVLMAVGANVIVKKNIEEAKSSIQEQEKQIILMISQLKSDTEKIVQAVYSIQQELG